jgi:SAM-dependent methyltransferase
MRRLLYGHVVSNALCSLAELGIPDLIGDGALSAAELAEQTAAHAPSLRQTLRALAVFGVFVEHPDGTFGLTPLGATLRTGAWASALPTALLVGNEIGQAWNGFEMTVRTGVTAFSTVFDTDFFSYVDLKPETRAVFDRSQQHGLELDIESITEALDLSSHELIVDVGGGDGALLAHLLAAYPRARGIILDLPRVLPKARERIAATGLAGRCEARAGDFLVEVPAGGDLYLLRQILHDWDDEHCRKILRACRSVLAPGGKLLVIDMLARELGAADPAGELVAIMDLYMLSIFDGKERTRAEFTALLASEGFTVDAVTSLAHGMAAIEASSAA